MRVRALFFCIEQEMLEQESSEKYAAMSQRYMDQAEEEFEKGDLGQASNKAWGAAALALKSIAEQRGWNHNRHGLLYDISGQMADELGRAWTARQFVSGARTPCIRTITRTGWLLTKCVTESRMRKLYLRELGSVAGTGWGDRVRAGDGRADGEVAAADRLSVRVAEPQKLGEWCDVSTARTKGQSR